jgi:hypothetical protein
METATAPAEHENGKATPFASHVHISEGEWLVVCVRRSIGPSKSAEQPYFFACPPPLPLPLPINEGQGASPRQKGGEAEETKQHRKERGTGETHPPIRPSAWSLVSGDSSFGSSYFP